MGNWYSSRISDDLHPIEGSAPSFDSHLGFGEREERVMKVSDEDLSALKVPFEKRDYCAHIWVDYLKCRRDNYPFLARCSKVHHHWEQCEYDDHMLRMKEYERERRLLERAKRKSAREAKDED